MKTFLENLDWALCTVMVILWAAGIVIGRLWEQWKSGAELERMVNRAYRQGRETAETEYDRAYERGWVDSAKAGASDLEENLKAGFKLELIAKSREIDQLRAAHRPEALIDANVSEFFHVDPKVREVALKTVPSSSGGLGMSFEVDPASRDSKDEMIAALSGAEAFSDGIAFTACPHDMGSTLRAPWRIGWMEAAARVEDRAEQATAFDRALEAATGATVVDVTPRCEGEEL